MPPDEVFLNISGELAGNLKASNPTLLSELEFVD
jgi:hypothetical protein